MPLLGWISLDLRCRAASLGWGFYKTKIFFTNIDWFLPVIPRDKKSKTLELELCFSTPSDVVCSDAVNNFVATVTNCQLWFISRGQEVLMFLMKISYVMKHGNPPTWVLVIGAHLYSMRWTDEQHEKMHTFIIGTLIVWCRLKTYWSAHIFLMRNAIFSGRDIISCAHNFCGFYISYLINFWSPNTANSVGRCPAFH